VEEREIDMRSVIGLVLFFVVAAAQAGEVDEAHRQALQGRDSYWNCLAREYTQDRIKSMSAEDFTASIASACPSERQNFRVTLLDYLNTQYPDVGSDAHLTTANRAIELAQKDIVTAFVRRKAAPN
jgi:hypothetical protein